MPKALFTASKRARSSAPAWAPLQPGSLVDLVAPGSGCDAAILAAGVQQLQEWGLRVRTPDVLFDTTPLVASCEDNRWRQLRRALYARDSAAVWCIRGGYGCMHLTPRLINARPPARAKPLIGFSDVSALLHALASSWGWVGLHAPVVAQLSGDQVAGADLKRLSDLLFGRVSELTFKQLRRLPPGTSGYRADGLIRGRLLGGNLATLQSLAGSQGAPAFRNAVVFLEDVNERGYTVDRMLRAMEAGGMFKGARAVVLGEFLGGCEVNGTNLVPRALANLAQRLRCPVFSGMPAGHGRRAFPLPIGGHAEILLNGTHGHLTVRLAA